MNILIIKLGAIGDVLRTTFILAGLKEKYPGCNLFWITHSGSADLLRNNQNLKTVYTYHPKIFTEIKALQFDLVVSLDDDFEACVLATQLEPKKITGGCLKEGQPSYTDDAAPWFDMGLISRFGKERADQLKKENRKTYQKIIAGILGINEYRPELFLAKTEKEFAARFCKENGIRGPMISINTGAGSRWRYKSLGIEKTIELIEHLKRRTDTPLVLFGGPEERERNQRILEKTGIIDAGCENSLLNFAALIDQCDVLITSDSLAMNLAVALGKKTVVFFSVSSAMEIEGYGQMEKIIAPVSCVCCYRRDCDIKPNCMEEISPAAIADKALQLL